MVKVLIYIYTLFIFSMPVLIRHLWQLKTVLILHRYLIHSVPLCSICKLYFGVASGGQSSNIYFYVVYFFNARDN